MAPAGLSRRRFLRVGAATGGGLLVTVAVPSAAYRFAAFSGARPQGPGEPLTLTAFVEISPAGRVILVAPCPEIGQGVRTSLPMLIAEELGVDWSAVEYRQASADARYGSMASAGSNSVADYQEPLRIAGAGARWVLVEAAARRWGVDHARLDVRSGEVIDQTAGRRAGFGELADAASRLQPPDELTLEQPEDFELVGSPTGIIDARDIVTGRARYGIDTDADGALQVVVARCPVHGGRLLQLNDRAARAVPGVVTVLPIEPLAPDGQLYGAVRAGVAVAAERLPAAIDGRDALEIDWDTGRWGDESSEALRDRLRAAVAGPGADVVRNDGDALSALADSATVLEAEYELPILAHASLEPMNFTAAVDSEGARLWGPTQNPRALQRAAATALGLAVESVQVHPTLAGGGFGRRLAYDYGVEAALIAQRLGRPAKVTWTRDDDLRHDYYRTPSQHRLEAAIADDGAVLAWRHRLATASLLHDTVERSDRRDQIPAGIFDVQGAADAPYEIDHLRVEYTPVEIGLQTGSFRSVSHSFNVFAVCSFLDEIAAATGADPLELQLRLLGPPRVARLTLPLPGRRGAPAPDVRLLRRVLEVAARRAGWGRPLPRGRGRGIAHCYYKQTYAAHVAEVTVADGHVRVDRVVAAVDPGRVVNPSGAAAQAEGAVMDGVASVLHWGITIADGRVQAANFDDYPLLTMREAPAVEVELLPSEREPSGMGEPPFPSVAPAIANAIFAATGRRIRRLPIRRGDL